MSEARDAWEGVLEDMRARRELGLARYGVPLTPFCKTRSLADLREELLDGLAYLQKLKEELTWVSKSLDVLLARLADEVSAGRVNAELVSTLHSISERSRAAIAE